MSHISHCFLLSARGIADIIETLSTTTTTSAPVQAGSSAAGAPVFAGAAGGGALILILLILLLVARNRRNKAKQPKREVIAFENPMYDTANNATGGHAPAQTGDDHQGLYSEQGGLYDEPAFKAKSNKDNPMYNSQEMLDQVGHVLTSGGDTGL